MSFDDWVNLHNKRIDSKNVSIPEDIRLINMDPTEIKEVTLDNKHVKDYWNYYPILIIKNIVYYINIENGTDNTHKISRRKINNNSEIQNSIKQNSKFCKTQFNMNVISWNDTKINFPKLYNHVLSNITPIN